MSKGKIMRYLINFLTKVFAKIVEIFKAPYITYTTTRSSGIDASFSILFTIVYILTSPFFWVYVKIIEYKESHK